MKHLLTGFLILFFASYSSAQEEEATEVEEIVVSSGVSARDIRKLGKMINSLINDNDDTAPRSYHRKLMAIDDYALEKGINNTIDLFPEICERLHPHNIQVANRFRSAGWSLNYKSKNFDTDFIRNYHLSACSN